MFLPMRSALPGPFPDLDCDGADVIRPSLAQCSPEPAGQPLRQPLSSRIVHRQRHDIRCGKRIDIPCFTPELPLGLPAFDRQDGAIPLKQEPVVQFVANATQDRFELNGAYGR